MFNPFKKKEEDGFQMNDMELPSLGDMDSPTMPNSNNEPSNMQMPELGGLDGTPSMPAQSDPMGMPNLESQDDTLDQTPGIGGLNDSNSTPSFETQPIPITPANEVSSVQSSSGTSEQQNLHNEVSKAKLDNIGTRMELLENKITKIDNKLDLILQLIQAEVSTETKMKLNMDAKMQQFR
ncbi:MAG: hypothetical protein HRU03_09100 [Nanoarchaeales archaeon]|nr:hypothetical protein [Nanoarchaeales archaeon]